METWAFLYRLCRDDLRHDTCRPSRYPISSFTLNLERPNWLALITLKPLNHDKHIEGASIKEPEPPTPPPFILGADIKFAIVIDIDHNEAVYICCEIFIRE